MLIIVAHARLVLFVLYSDVESFTSVVSGFPSGAEEGSYGELGTLGHRVDVGKECLWILMMSSTLHEMSLRQNVYSLPNL